jgi:hypothetical protein
VYVYHCMLVAVYYWDTRLLEYRPFPSHGADELTDITENH